MSLLSPTHMPTRRRSHPGGNCPLGCFPSTKKRVLSPARPTTSCPFTCFFIFCSCDSWLRTRRASGLRRVSEDLRSLEGVSGRLQKVCARKIFLFAGIRARSVAFRTVPSTNNAWLVLTHLYATSVENFAVLQPGGVLDLQEVSFSSP